MKQGRAVAPDASPVTRIGPVRLEEEGVAAPLPGPEFARLEAERKRLEARIDALEAELEARARRQHQLLGERDELRAQLREREREAGRLNREIGSLTVVRRPARARGLFGSLLDALARLRSRPTVMRPKSPAAPAAPIPTSEPALVPWVKEGRARPILCVVMSGLAREGVAASLDLIERQGQQRGMVPLVLTDDDDFRPFRGRRLVVEYLPPQTALEAAAPGRPADVYLQRRLALIRRKWQPARIIAFGPGAAATIRLWQESPFETRPIPAFADGPAPGSSLPLS